MDWKVCAHITAFLLLLISLQCSCDWRTQVNKGKDEKGQITWENFHSGRRQKREWIVPPTVLREGEDNRYRNPIAKVHSDIEIKEPIYYRITGQGVDQPPFNVFIMDQKTGYLNVTDIRIDREEISMLALRVHAVTASGRQIEKPLDLFVKIQDINDNAPVFSQSVFMGSVEERCRANTMVMQITATDADEKDTRNSQIAYKIISQDPSDPPMFIMNQYTGQVFTLSNSIDREAFSSYSLVVSGSDLNGAAGGLSGQCGAQIKVLDVNDNFPIMEYESYQVKIEENMVGLTDLRMKAFDADEMYTDNWYVVYEIISGNDGGWFVIDTDAETNEGVLRVVKELDYETMASLNLIITAVNRAAFHYSVMSEYQAKQTNIAVQVQNVREGPAFVPNVINLVIPAGLSQEEMMKLVLAKAAAIDMDTGKPATNVVYSLDKNLSKYFMIDPVTGEIKATYQLVKEGLPTSDNGTFGGIVYAEDTNLPNRPRPDGTGTEAGTGAGTGSATILVNAAPTSGTPSGTCPVMTQEPRIVCENKRTTIIAAYQQPSNPPYNITLAPNDYFYITKLNDTAVTLMAKSTATNRNYTLQFYVSDKNNMVCPNPFTIVVQFCECNDGGTCNDASKFSNKSVSLGPAAIGLMVLGFLILLLALLLLPLCLCGAAAATKFVPVAVGNDGACAQWETEGGKPEDVDVRSMLINSAGPDSDIHTSNYGPATMAEGFSGSTGGRGISAGGMGAGGMGTSTIGYETNTLLREPAGFTIDRDYNGSLYGAAREGGTLNMAYVESYFADKAEAFANDDEGRPANDCLLIYDNEGVGSPAGSVGCCSFIADDLDDSFLDTLGPKFKTLAEICIGSEIDPIPRGDRPTTFANIPIVETDTNVIVDESTVNVTDNRSVPMTSSTYLTESTFSSTNLQPARPIPEPVIPNNVYVTETYTTTDNPVRSVIRNVEPSILVTERVLAPTSSPYRMFTEMPEGSNVIVTERVVRPTSGVHEIIELPNMSGLVDSSNVVLRERAAAPSTSRLSNSFNFPDLGDAQNVVVTERVIQPISTLQGGLTIRPEMGSSQNIYVTETVRSNPAVTTHMLSPESLLTVGSTSPSLTRSSVTKYSTVQYTKK